MPTFGPSTTAPYPLVNDVLDSARTRLNDAIGGLSGDFLNVTTNSDVVQSLTNTAWQKFQEFSASIGMVRLQSEIIFSGIPAVSNTDPVVQVALNWTEYNNGSAVFDTFQFPQDLIAPLDLWERITGSNGTFREMSQISNGLPTLPKDLWLRTWEFRNDVLYMPGALVDVDLRVRYAAYLPDFIKTGDVEWYQQTAAIMRCGDALSNYICAEVAGPRGDLDAASFRSAGEDAARKLAGRDFQGDKLVQKASEYGRMKDRYTQPDKTAMVSQ